MAVSDLTNTTWEIKEWPTISTSTDNTYSINFTANNISYTAFRLRNNGEYNYIYYNTTKVFDSDLGSWGDYSNYRTINITGGTDVTNANLISWLTSNATQQGGGTAGKTQIGTRTITKKMFGTREITKEVVNGVVVYEKQAPSTYSVSGNYRSTGGSSAQFVGCQYSTDNGTTWNNLGTSISGNSILIEDITQIKFRCCIVYGEDRAYIRSTQLGLDILADRDTGTGVYVYSNNYTLTQNITDLDAYYDEY